MAHWCKYFKANGNGRTPNACEKCGRVVGQHEGQTLKVHPTMEVDLKIEAEEGAFARARDIEFGKAEELKRPEYEERQFDTNPLRIFDTGATRDTDDGKLDYEGFLSPEVLEEFAAYMHKNRIQSDGSLRDSDNWQKGIPLDAYMKSLLRHLMEVWIMHRRRGDGAMGYNPEHLVEHLLAMFFNVQGYLHEMVTHDREWSYGEDRS